MENNDEISKEHLGLVKQAFNDYNNKMADKIM
jgi:hypothetical protein